MHSPYRELAEVQAYPKLNPPSMEAPTYGRTHGCRCCNFSQIFPSYFPDYSNNDYLKIEYAWCLNCLKHYESILNTFNFYSCAVLALNYDGDTSRALAGLGRIVWFASEHDINILQHVVNNYHIPLILYPRNIHTRSQWQPTLLPMKTSRSKVSLIITRLKKMLGLK